MRTNEQVASATRRRKDDHLEICLTQDVASEVTNGFERYRLTPITAPEADFSEASIGRTFLGKDIAAPLMISSMTGGTARGAVINAHLCEAAESRRIPLALGSLRVYAEARDAHRLSEIRSHAPTIPVLANFGAVQLNYGLSADAIRAALDAVRADGLILHFNVLQELIQPGGDTNFSGLMAKIEALRKAFSLPLVAKEVGFGFDIATVGRLLDAGIDWIDVAGAGGTSWAKVEMYARGETPGTSLYAPFNGFGVPTAEAVSRIHGAYPNAKLIASGGIRNGVEMRKAELLGAVLSGAALPFLAPALESADAVAAVIDRFTAQYKTARFVSSDLEKIEDFRRDRGDESDVFSAH